MLSKSLEYLWKHTHCSAVKINLYHFKVMKKKAGAKEATPTMDADQDLKAMLKQLKFKWKNIKNVDGFRYETQELGNAEYGDQMRQSKAQIYRRGLTREDVLKEPLTIFFSSMVAFGHSKRDNKSELLMQYQPAQIQSQAAMLSNLLVYNYEVNRTKIKQLQASQESDAVRQIAEGEQAGET